MDYREAYALESNYVPPALYTISEISHKRETFNPVHSELLNKTAYPLHLNEGERGYICVDVDENGDYHLLHTSSIKKTTPWKTDVERIVIETNNTIYTLNKKNCGEDHE